MRLRVERAFRLLAPFNQGKLAPGRFHLVARVVKADHWSPPEALFNFFDRDRDGLVSVEDFFEGQALIRTRDPAFLKLLFQAYLSFEPAALARIKIRLAEERKAVLQRTELKAQRLRQQQRQQQQHPSGQLHDTEGGNTDGSNDKGTSEGNISADNDFFDPFGLFDGGSSLLGGSLPSQEGAGEGWDVSVFERRRRSASSGSDRDAWLYTETVKLHHVRSMFDTRKWWSERRKNKRQASNEPEALAPHQETDRVFAAAVAAVKVDVAGDLEGTNSVQPSSTSSSSHSPLPEELSPGKGPSESTSIPLEKEELRFPQFCRAALAVPVLIDVMIAETKSRAISAMAIQPSSNATPMVEQIIVEEEEERRRSSQQT